MNYRRVNLDTIPSLHFTKTDALSPDEKRERQHQLVSATALTMFDHEEVGLVIKLADGESIEVVSNLIDYEGDFVELKGGYIIPLRAIVKVEM